MKNAKTGLRLLSFSIFTTIAWIIVGSIIQIIQNNTASASDIDIHLISTCVSVGCYVIELIALYIAGKDNKHFHRASFLKIASLVLGIACLILIAVTKNASGNTKNVINTVNHVVSVFVSVADVIALLSIVKGCKEISPRVKGQANLVLVCFVIMSICTITISFLKVDQGNVGIVALALFLIIALLVAAVIYAINYIILIFRTTKHVGKSR